VVVRDDDDAFGAPPQVGDAHRERAQVLGPYRWS
jgi:hypothetical protein